MQPKRPAHRPPLPPEDRLQVVSIRLSPAERDKLAKLGGGAWVRTKIAKAKITEKHHD